jgi:hypothetical protein
LSSPEPPSAHGQPRAPSPPDQKSSSYRTAKHQAVSQRQPGQDPGRRIGIVGLIFALGSLICLISISVTSAFGVLLAFSSSLIGLIICIVTYRQSAQARFKNKIALAGIIIGAISLVVSIVLLVLFITAVISDS